MYKIQLLLFICVLLASASGSSGGLIACYEFENDVRDSSGNGYDGIIGGAPEFVSGYSGKALRFDGANDYVDLSAHHAVLSSLGNFTLSMWAEGYDSTTNKVLFCWTDGTVNQRVQMHGGAGGRIGWLAVNSTGSYPAWLEAWTWTPGTWYHLAFVNDTTEGRKIYVNGVEMAIISGDNTPTSPSDLTGATFVRIANRAGSTASWLGGIDEVRIYDKALTPEEIQEVMIKAPAVKVSQPSPANGATDVPRDVVLSWRPGKFANKHDVYFGTNLDDVNNATPTMDPAGVYMGRQDLNTYVTDRLDLGHTYYWRIDEVNEAESPAIWQGDVWSFTTQEYLVVDDFESYNDLDPGDPESNRIFLTWIGGDNDPANGSQVGHDTFPFAETTIVHGGSQSMPLYYDNSTATFSEATADINNLAIGQDWPTNGAGALSLWFRGLPPLYGSFVMGPPITMTARGTGMGGASDQLHFAYQLLSGNGSITAKVVSLTNTSTAAAAGVMIRESLSANAMQAMVAVTPTSGVVFVGRSSAGSSSTIVAAQSGVAAPQWIRLTRAGRTFTAEYSADGTMWTELGTRLTMPYLSLSGDLYVGLFLTSGTASATCTAEFSDVTTVPTLSGAWQSQDIGIATNASAEQIYVVLKDSATNTAVVKYPDAAATTIDVWTEWNIPLADFTGVNMQAIKTISIGVGDRTAPQAGGSGLLYVDDIRLYPDVTITPVAPDPNRLVAWYKFENDVRDSSGNGYDGIIGGAPEFVSGYSGKALRFDGANDYVDLSAHHAVLSSLGDFTLSMWAEGYDGTTNKVLFCWTDGTVKQRVQIHGGSGGRIGWLAVNSTGSYTAWMEEAWTWTPGTWYHLAFVNDTTEGRKIYVNGVEMAISGGNTPASPSDLMGATFVRIANRAGSTASWLGGIDEVRIYDKALSGGEILYLAGTAAMDMR